MTKDRVFTKALGTLTKDCIKVKLFTTPIDFSIRLSVPFEHMQAIGQMSFSVAVRQGCRVPLLESVPSMCYFKLARSGLHLFYSFLL